MGPLFSRHGALAPCQTGSRCVLVAGRSKSASTPQSFLCSFSTNSSMSFGRLVLTLLRRRLSLVQSSLGKCCRCPEWVWLQFRYPFAANTVALFRDRKSGCGSPCGRRQCDLDYIGLGTAAGSALIGIGLRASSLQVVEHPRLQDSRSRKANGCLVGPSSPSCSCSARWPGHVRVAAFGGTRALTRKLGQANLSPISHHNCGLAPA